MFRALFIIIFLSAYIILVGPPLLLYGVLTGNAMPTSGGSLRN